MLQVSLVVKIKNMTTFESTEQLIPILTNQNHQATINTAILQTIMSTIDIYSPDFNEALVVVDMTNITSILSKLVDDGWSPTDKKILQNGELYFTKRLFHNSPSLFSYQHEFDYEIDAIYYQETKETSDRLINGKITEESEENTLY